MTDHLGRSETSGTAATMMEKELRRTAAWVWGATGCFREDSAGDLLVEIHDRLTGIMAAFRREIEEATDDD